jgi:hypothetical protein
MATDLTSGEAADDGPKPDESPAEVPAERPALPQPAERPHRSRFVVIYGILALALAAALAGVVVFAGRSINAPPSWSSWKPSGGGQGAAKQIAAHVSQSYRLPSGKQLVDVIAKAPSVSPANQQIPIHYVVVRGKKGTQDKVVPVSSTDSVMYSLCGLGTSCAIATGKPSVERGTLVRRQILELALYTFKYVGGMKSVIAFMPPTPGAQPQYVVYIEKSDVADHLKTPLLRTLGARVPLPSSIPRKEQQTIDAVTETRVYKFSLSQAQQGDAILVLDPLTA